MKKTAISIISLFFMLVHIYYAFAKEETAMQIKSPAFEDNGMIPKKYTCDGVDVSPPLSWSKPPAGAKSIAVICDDPDAPMGTWVHWVLYGLSPETTSLSEGVPPEKEALSGARQGINDFRKIGYGGPCPPRGPAHRYFFKIYALDIELTLASGATKKDVEKAMKGHILAQGELVGRYGR
ncbi:MAG: YbhB/YbcL family Raf kinase inhibitor-like protein [Deltaproteobacteria bacterium]|nr:YbhB/YbcL family Raf kinase inhibitor-like protein [Deltaproteobacteria bacterium]